MTERVDDAQPFRTKDGRDNYQTKEQVFGWTMVTKDFERLEVSPSIFPMIMTYIDQL